jgi:hypothetical protein
MKMSTFRTTRKIGAAFGGLNYLKQISESKSDTVSKKVSQNDLQTVYDGLCFGLVWFGLLFFGDTFR